MLTQIEVGTQISWTSAAGNLIGKVTKIRLAPAGNGKITPWIIVKPEGKNPLQLCGNDDYLKMMKVAVIG